MHKKCFKNRVFGHNNSKERTTMTKSILISMVAAFVVVTLTALAPSPVLAQDTTATANPDKPKPPQCPPKNAISVADCQDKCGTNCPPKGAPGCKNKCTKMTFNTSSNNGAGNTDTGKKKHRGGGNVAKVLTSCPGANGGAGGELALKKGESCPDCPEGSQPSKDNNFCEKACGPAFGQMFPIANFAKTCPSCESRSMKTSKDGTCFKEQVIATPAAPTCTDCGCDRWCWTVWDIILAVLVLALAVIIFIDRKRFVDKVRSVIETARKQMNEALKEKVSKDELKGLVGNTVSRTELDGLFITREQIPRMLKLDRLIATKERELAGSRQALKRLEDDSTELDRHEAGLKKLEDAALKAATELSELEEAKAELTTRLLAVDMTNAAELSAFNAEKLDLLGKFEKAKAADKAAKAERDAALKAAKAERDELANELKSETAKAQRLEAERDALNTELSTGAPPIPSRTTGA